MCLDYILIYGKLGLPAFGAKGAALGSILSLIVYLGIYSYTARHLVQIDLRIPQILKKIKDKIRFSIPFLAQEFMEDILFVVGLNMIVARWIYRCAESACPVFWKSPVRKEEITVPDR